VTWIDRTAPEHAHGPLAELYQRVRGPDGAVDNILQAHSLRPHTLTGHMGLYKSVLHHPANSLDPWFREALGVLVSQLNKCEYCVAHHTAGMRRLIDDDARSDVVAAALISGSWGDAFDSGQRAALAYARALTVNPSALDALDIDDLRAAGWDDGEILEINQIVAYFGYANRTVLGLGVETGGERLGAAPVGGDEDDWRHA
jgi:uncharacterized peroxidase-related enzyme